MSAVVSARPTKAPTRWQDDPLFLAFYRNYPRQVGPGGPHGAYAAWKGALKIATFGEIMRGLANYPFSAERNFQPHPSTWLRQERWTGVVYREPATAESVPYRNGALSLLMETAAPGETADAVYERTRAEIDARAAGTLIDHDPSEGEGLFEALSAPPDRERHQPIPRRGGGPRALSDVVGGMRQ